MNEANPIHPSVTVLGLYSPSADTERYEQFVQSYVARSDPKNFSADTIATFKRLGREADLAPLTAEERNEVEDEIRYNLGSVAYVEVLVRNADQSFDPGQFKQPDPSLREGLWQVAWNETYLSEDGKAVVAGYPLPAVPTAPVLRVVFTIHFWNPSLALVSSYGELMCPPMAPLPERLWRLVPYEMPD